MYRGEGIGVLEARNAVFVKQRTRYEHRSYAGWSKSGIPESLTSQYSLYTYVKLEMGMDSFKTPTAQRVLRAGR